MVKGTRASGTFPTSRAANEFKARRTAEILAQDPEKPTSTKTLADALDEYALKVSPTKRGSRWELIRLGKDASAKTLRDTSDYLSKLYISIFEQAGCVDLKFHDLRHEAVSRLFERTTLTETAIMKISGHKSQRMLLRYSNLRGADMASAMW